MEEKDKVAKKNEAIVQRRILKKIIGNGVKFTVNYTVKVRQKGLKGLFRPKTKEERKEEFVMKEPTLAVLDRASEVWLRMNTDGLDQDGDDEQKEGFKAVRNHAKDMAECLAILVLGEEYYAVDGGDDKEIARLKDLFYKTVKPSQTHDVAMFVNAISNIEDFTNSMRLMKVSVTTAPATRIESVE